MPFVLSNVNENFAKTVYLLTRIALRTCPAFQAGLVAILVTGVMSKELVTWPAELVASKAVVVFIAGYPDLVLKLGDRAVMGQPLPLSIWVDHARVGCFLDELST